LGGRARLGCSFRFVSFFWLDHRGRLLVEAEVIALLLGGLGGVEVDVGLGDAAEEARPLSLAAIVIAVVGVARLQVDEVLLAAEERGLELVRRICRGGGGRGGGLGRGRRHRGRRGLGRGRGLRAPLLLGLVGLAGRLARGLLLVGELGALGGAALLLLRRGRRGRAVELVLLGGARGDGALLLGLGLGGGPGRAAREDVLRGPGGEVLVLGLQGLAELEAADGQIHPRVAVLLQERADLVREEAPLRPLPLGRVGVLLLLLLLGLLAADRARGLGGDGLGREEGLERGDLALEREDLSAETLDLREDHGGAGRGHLCWLSVGKVRVVPD
jgi:hypothetical protein